jgi:putative endonuclease
MYATYILRSEKSNRFYTGHTENMDVRLIRHNTGMVKATRNKGPWEIVYLEYFNTKVEANRREMEIKSKKSRLYIEKLILNKMVEPVDTSRPKVGMPSTGVRVRFPLRVRNKIETESYQK